MRPQDGGKNPNGCEHDNDIADGIVARARRDRTNARVAVLVGDDGPTLAIVERDVRPVEKPSRGFIDPARLDALSRLDIQPSGRELPSAIYPHRLP